MEIWKDIKWYEWMFQVSNYWRVKSLEKHVQRGKGITLQREKIRTPQYSDKWNATIILSKDKKVKGFIVWRLVLQTFVWESEWYVNFKDWDKRNLKLSNLEYISVSEHTKDMFKQGRRKANLPNKWKKFWEAYNARAVNQFDKSWEFIREWDSARRVEKELWICNVSRACNDIKQSAWWYLWRFKT